MKKHSKDKEESAGAKKKERKPLNRAALWAVTAVLAVCATLGGAVALIVIEATSYYDVDSSVEYYAQRYLMDPSDVSSSSFRDSVGNYNDRMRSANDRMQSARSSGDARGMERGYKDANRAQTEFAGDVMSGIGGLLKKGWDKISGTDKAKGDLLETYRQYLEVDHQLEMARKQLLIWVLDAIAILLLFIHAVKKSRRPAAASAKGKRGKSKMIEADSMAAEQGANDGTTKDDTTKEAEHSTELAVIAASGAATASGMVHKQGVAESRAKKAARLRGSFSFSGRTRCRSFWLFVLGHVLLLTVISMVCGAMYETWPFFAYVIITLWPLIALGFRRMHDVGKPGGFCFIPIYGLILALRKGQAGENKYGADPRTK